MMQEIMTGSKRYKRSMLRSSSWLWCLGFLSTVSESTCSADGEQNLAAKHLVQSDRDRRLLAVEGIQVGEGATVGAGCPVVIVGEACLEAQHSGKYSHIYAVSFCWRLRLQLWYCRQSFVTDIILCINTSMPMWLMVVWPHADFDDYNVESCCVSNDAPLL